MKKAAVFIICLMTLGPTAALADHDRYERVVIKERHSHHGNHTVVKKVVTVKQPGRHKNRGRWSHRYEPIYGRVVSVEPIYRYAGHDRGRDSCVRYRDDYRRNDSYTPALLGAIIGGAVGHRLGDNHGDPGAAAIAGTLLGASIGRDVGRHAERGRNLVVDGPCGHDGRDYRRREVVEYAVRYRYNGRVYVTHMDYDPGEWIELDVKPA